MMPRDFILESHEHARNPILSASDVSDIDKAQFVADPFYTYCDGKHYVFFEILDSSGKGVIGYATSRDRLNWTYRQAILEEPFHLAFPYVFQHESEWYLAPDYRSDDREQPLRIYKASEFPTDWSLFKKYSYNKNTTDPIILQWNGVWYIFVQDRKVGVNLYFSDNLWSDAWILHPDSPITTTENIGRMAGRPFILDQQLHLLFQDGKYLYGEKVRCFRISVLNKNRYEHEEISTSPIVQGQFNRDWNHRGMHHVDLSPSIDYGHDFVLVDGCNKGDNWSIGLYEISHNNIRITDRSLSLLQKRRRYWNIFEKKIDNTLNILRGI